jgi:hypothetical protein
MDRQRFLVTALTVITVWRLALLPTLELSPDEALGALYAYRPDLWHVEMGPLTPWLMRLSMAVLGQTEMGVRFLAPLLGFAASIFLWRIGRGVATPTVASWGVALLQVLPAFNIAATSMTSSIVGLTAVLGCVMSLRIALIHAHPRHQAWAWTAVFLLLAILADWRNGLSYLCIVAWLGIPERRRHHLRSWGFQVITAAAALGMGAFLLWNQMHGWPVWEIGEAEAQWAVAPNLLRWMILVSPLMLMFFLWSIPLPMPRLRSLHGHSPLLCFILPYAALDLAYGPVERWPQMGWPVWMALSGLVAADHFSQILGVETRRRVWMRTGAFLLAAVMSLTLLRTDLVRGAGIPWTPVWQKDPRQLWRRWLWEDPAGVQMGWQQAARALGVMVKSPGPDGKGWFLMADQWEMAATLEFYLPADAPTSSPEPGTPKMQVLQTVRRSSPHALWPRYDAAVNGTEPYAGRSALLVTDASAAQPPREVKASFQRTELRSVMRIMHGGKETRTLKIFACHGYHPPEF